VNVTLFTVNPPEIVTVAPLTNPVPAMLKVIEVLFGTLCGRADVGDVIVGGATMLKHPVHEPMPASPFVTVTLRDPVGAFEATLMLAVSWVADTKVVELTVIPAPEKDTTAPLVYPVPVTVMFWFVAPCPRELGLVEVTVGAAFTVKHPLQVATPASPFVMVTSLVAAVALLVIVMLAFTCVADTNVVEFTVMPVPEKAAERAPPLTNPDPVTVMV
jgi:hypothetical protein